ncbi:MAG TPA: host attachment family protein [Methylomirabilota bacterium]|nr:host attachment family protein [Methylomirabilota bacterium]
MSDDVLIASNETLVVCDGRKMIVYRNMGTRERPSFTVETELSRSDRPDRDIVTDRPGRMDAMPGGPRSAFDRPDHHELEEEDFLRTVASGLEDAVSEGRIKSLVVAAAPRALGTLRKAYPSGVKSVLRAEIASDFVRMPVPDLERHFGRLAEG